MLLALKRLVVLMHQTNGTDTQLPHDEALLVFDKGVWKGLLDTYVPFLRLPFFQHGMTAK